MATTALTSQDSAILPNLRSNYPIFNPSTITLFVLGILIAGVGIGVGVVGFANALAIGRTFSLVLLIAGPAVGTILIVIGIYKKTLYNLFNGLPSANKHNEQTKGLLDLISNGVLFSEEYSAQNANLPLKSGWKNSLVCDVQITKDTAAETIKQIKRQIDGLTQRSELVFINSSGRIDKGVGSITVQLFTLAKA